MKRYKLYAGTTQDKDFVTEVAVPHFIHGEPDVLIWGNRYFKRSGDVDQELNWKYIECFVYAVA